MESAIGHIVSMRDETVTVVVDSPVACRRCAAGNGCGAGILAGLEQTHHIDIARPLGSQFEIGDPVSLCIAPSALLRAALIAYGLPLLALVAGSGVSWMFGMGLDDHVAVGTAITCLLLGIMASRRILADDRACAHFVPAIVVRKRGGVA